MEDDIPQEVRDSYEPYHAMNKAYWAWVEANCPETTKVKRAAWCKANAFPYEGKLWRRISTPYRSNSGQATEWETTYRAGDGTTVESPPSRYRNNRRNGGLLP